MLTCRQQNNVMAKLCRLSDYIELVSLETSLECVKAAYTTSIESYADRKALLLTRIIPIVIKFIDEEYELSAKQG